MNRRSLFSALALVLALSTTALAQRSMIRGKVHAPNNSPLNNAIVELRVGGGGMIGQAVTRNEGDFEFTGLQPGEYEIAVTASGFEPTVQIVRFSNTEKMNFMEVLNVEIIVRPKADAPLSAPSTYFAQDVPKLARAAYDKAIAKLREGKSEEGMALLHEATATFNEYFDAHFMLGKELFRAGRDNDALEELERARQINDKQDALYQMFGLVMLKQKKFNLAQRIFREAISINANNTAAHYYRGMALIELAIREGDNERVADLNEAEKELERAWELSDKRLNDVYLQRARIYERRGNKDAAAHELEQYLKAEPDAKNAAAIRQAITALRGTRK
jgi:tetratricopeptide (TPR) repeat protein